MSQPQPKIPDLRDLQDNVPETLHPILNWAGKNSKLIIGVLSVVILAVAAYSVIKVVTGHRESSARDELAEILLSGPSDTEFEQLAALAEDAPEGVALRARFELAAAQADAKEYEAAAQTFAELANTTDPDLRALATMSQARCLLLDGRPDQAMGVLGAVKDAVPEAYSGPVTRLYATAAEAAGQPDVAVAAYQELLSKGQGVDTEYLLYKLNQLSADAQTGS